MLHLVATPPVTVSWPAEADVAIVLLEADLEAERLRIGRVRAALVSALEHADAIASTKPNEARGIRRAVALVRAVTGPLVIAVGPPGGGS